MTTTTNLIERLRLGASISRDRKINHDYSEVSDWAADLIEAQAKQIAELEKTGNEWYEAHDKKRIQLAEQAKQIEVLQAEADYWRARYAALAHKGNV
jgi:uncharacterized protein (DUF305 family)